MEFFLRDHLDIDLHLHFQKPSWHPSSADQDHPETALGQNPADPRLYFFCLFHIRQFLQIIQHQNCHFPVPGDFFQSPAGQFFRLKIHITIIVRASGQQIPLHKYGLSAPGIPIQIHSFFHLLGCFHIGNRQFWPDIGIFPFFLHCTPPVHCHSPLRSLAGLLSSSAIIYQGFCSFIW